MRWKPINKKNFFLLPKTETQLSIMYLATILSYLDNSRGLGWSVE